MNWMIFSIKGNLKMDEGRTLIGSENDLCIVSGSESDFKEIGEEKMASIQKTLKKVGLLYDISVISADRNPEQLQLYCQQAVRAGTKVFIAIAGMKAVLPGEIVKLTKGAIPVIGVAMPSASCPSAEDALLTITRTAPGVFPAGYLGIGAVGLVHAVSFAAQIIGLTDSRIIWAMQQHLKDNIKPPKFGLSFTAVAEKEGK